MKQPTLEEVKEYFKNAKKCKDWNKDKFYADFNDVIFENGAWIQNAYKNNSGDLWNEDYGYAKILTYKEKTFSITKSQIKELDRKFNLDTELCLLIRNMIPEAFESEVKSLPNDYTGWIIDQEYPNVIAYSEKGFLKYGFDYESDWKEDTNAKLIGSEREATEQEVFEALKNEAVKRGFVKGAFIKHNGLHRSCKENELVKEPEFDFQDGKLWIDNCGDSGYSCLIFEKGKWAELQDTITLQEA